MINIILGVLGILLSHPWFLYILFLIIIILLLFFIIKRIIQKLNKPTQLFIVQVKIFEFIQNILKRQIGDVLLFENRDDAKTSFLFDIKNSKDLIFYGINHISIKQYLIDALSKDNFIPFWEKMYFYFANNQYGRIFNREHESLIIKNVISISSYLSEKRMRGELQHLKEVYFYQCKDTYHFGGSFFKHDNKKANVIYLVLYFPNIINFNSNDSITLKIKQGKTSLYDKSEKSFQYISEKKDELYKIDFFNDYDFWDKSVDSLFELQTRQLFYDKIKIDFFDFCSINSQDDILDLGSGTGFLSKYITEQINNIKITLVDKSSAMLNKSMEVLSEYKNINYLLKDIRCDKILYGAFEKSKFSKIIIFYAFQYFVLNINDIEYFALKLKQSITENGEVIIMLHNSFIKDKKNKMQKKWIDPIRKTIKEYAKEKNILVKDQSQKNFLLMILLMVFLKLVLIYLDLLKKKNIAGQS